jgi:hypothetical protein
VDQDDVEEPVEHRLLARCRGRQFAGEQADGVVKRVVVGMWQMEHGRERLDQLAAHVAGEPIGAAEEHGRFWITGVLIARVLSPEIVSGQADGGRGVGDVVVETTPNEGDVAGMELACRSWVVEPHPGVTANHGVNGELDGARQPEPPRGSCD